ncbi:Adenine phosphoribosyltransferase [Arcticibacter svalbardensis MN12-7]|uniref:Adenine phosphoribosyltransferase n=1 Tax=Arcticibacter svalbardensis MN12-7 TaxID=1150600 RepID=R9GLE6_9SPHI|nr:adenine phosphoribosyltransferase [Arcticibacter svalbardensis]EOR92538.1 Adenine phosphoribosyltransferase [Arcticibacter svalbardensis MN12-7]
MISKKIQSVVRDIYDFPKPGIVFKDVTPIFKDPALCTEIVDAFAEKLAHLDIDVIAGVESRGFLFGLMLANKLNKPFVPVRKPGKLPFSIVTKSYELEYGTATIEIHTDAFAPGSRVFVHDDLLATGGTAAATADLIFELGGTVAGFGFVIALGFLHGEEKLLPFSSNIISLTTY